MPTDSESFEVKVQVLTGAQAEQLRFVCKWMENHLKRSYQDWKDSAMPAATYERSCRHAFLSGYKAAWWWMSIHAAIGKSVSNTAIDQVYAEARKRRAGPAKTNG